MFFEGDVRGRALPFDARVGGRKAMSSLTQGCVYKRINSKGIGALVGAVFGEGLTLAVKLLF